MSCKASDQTNFNVHSRNKAWGLHEIGNDYPSLCYNIKHKEYMS